MVVLRIRDLHELLPVMVADVRRATRLQLGKLPAAEKQKPRRAGFLPMSAGASQPGGEEGALQAGPVWGGKLFAHGKVPSFSVARSRNRQTDGAFGERRRKHVPLGVVS